MLMYQQVPLSEAISLFIVLTKIQDVYLALMMTIDVKVI